MNQDTDKQFRELSDLKIPAKRAAYSDRTAWMMALLAELAYLRFSEESDDIFAELTRELANLATGDGVTPDRIKEGLKKLALTLATIGRDGTSDGTNSILKAALEAGGFELAGGAPIYEPSTDTQAFVAIRRAEDGTGLVVICFRGTQQVRDWFTNLKISTQLITDPVGKGGEVGKMHKGFHDAYMSVHDTINERLVGHENLPLYITGHSLGGALAVVATWYQSSQRLAACYTFGAPRVGDSGLLGRFKTPIYRVVNAADPVPFVPPSGLFLTGIKSILRFAGSLFSPFDIINPLLSLLVRIQPFRHYGDMRYLPLSGPGPNGDYPGLRMYNHVSNLERFWRFLRVLWINKLLPWQIQKFNLANDPDPTVPTTPGATTKKSIKPDRIDRYHDMSRYRDKLRAIAMRKNS